MKRQAKKGGETGANGEHYKGGQFIAESENTTKGAQRRAVSRKQEVGPYKWETHPDPDMRAIWGRVSWVCRPIKYAEWVNGVRVQADWSQMILDDELARVHNLVLDPVLYEMFKRLVERYNAGERWAHKHDCFTPEQHGYNR